MNDRFLSIDKMSTSYLVAIVLGKVEPDGICFDIADSISSYDLPLMARENTATAQKRVERVHAAIELGRRVSLAKPLDNLFLTRAEDVVAYMSPKYQGENREAFYCLALNTKNMLKRATLVSIGSLNASIVHPRELYTEAMRISAASVILVHNHPSGDPTPSGADIQLTRRIAKAGDILGIELIDHVVIGGGGPSFISLRDENLI